MEFTPSELALLSNALWTASLEYERIQKEMFRLGHLELAKQFDKQERDALTLRDKIDND